MIFKKVILLLLFLLWGLNYADDKVPRERYLHVSTNPSGADLYVGNAHPDFSRNPDYRIPAFVSVPLDKDQVLITLFRPDFRDTSINVTLSQKATSFLIVALAPAFDETFLQEQQADLNHRSRRNLGHRLMIASHAHASVLIYVSERIMVQFGVFGKYAVLVAKYFKPRAVSVRRLSDKDQLGLFLSF